MLVTSCRLKELLNYQPETGWFRWIREGFIAGELDPSGGYVAIGIKHRRYSASRLAWFYMTGRWPLHHIEHVNGDLVDDRFSNLREIASNPRQKDLLFYLEDNGISVLTARRHRGRREFLGSYQDMGMARTAGLQA